MPGINDRRGKGGKKKGSVDYIQERRDKKSTRRRSKLGKVIITISKFDRFFIEIQNFRKKKCNKQKGIPKFQMQYFFNVKLCLVYHYFYLSE